MPKAACQVEAVTVRMLAVYRSRAIIILDDRGYVYVRAVYGEESFYRIGINGKKRFIL